MKKNEYVSSQTEVAVDRPLILDERVRLEDNHENQQSKIPKSWPIAPHDLSQSPLLSPVKGSPLGLTEYPICIERSSSGR